ncbi:MAG: hypothetical protein JW818_03990 [Pirellulales bacterium]|nr:hypothetical protein [Pirellulales bacterium]
MSPSDLERQLAGHLHDTLNVGRAVHVLCSTREECLFTLALLQREFPNVTIGVPVGSACPTQSDRVEELENTCLDVMLSTVSDMCLHYQRARMAFTEYEAPFREAVAILINYDADELDDCPCCVGVPGQDPEAAMCVRPFLDVYAQVISLEGAFELP